MKSIYTLLLQIFSMSLLRIFRNLSLKRQEFLKRRDWFFLNKHSPLSRKDFQDFTERVFQGICRTQINGCRKAGKNYGSIEREIGQKYGVKNYMYSYINAYTRGEKQME